MRINKVSLIAGGRGVGKTNFIKKVLKASPINKKLVIDTFDSPPWRTLETYDNPDGRMFEIPVMPNNYLKSWKQGFYRLFSSSPERLFDDIEKHVTNAVIVFEDATKYLNGRLNDDVKRLVYDSKQKNLDLIFIFHSLGSIPPELVRAADTLTLFKTNEGMPNKDKYPFPDIPIVMDHLRRSKNRYENITIQLN